MKLLMEPKCYTDVCLHAKWFHHDHGQTSAYMLGSREVFDLGMMPTTDEELEHCLEPIAIKQLLLDEQFSYIDKQSVSKNMQN